MKGRRVLVTGAAGFLGRHLARALCEAGARVHAVLRPASPASALEGLPVELHRCDVRDARALHEVVGAAAPELVYSLAMAGGHPQEAAARAAMLEASVLGTANLLQAVRELDLPFVHLGSSLEYGGAGVRSEDDPAEPTSFRGVAKLCATLLCRQFARETGRRVVVLRVFSVYGPWEPPHRLVPTAVRAALRDQEMALTDGTRGRDLVFVDDVVEACLRCAEAELPPGTVLNVGGGERWSDQELVAAVEEVTQRAVRVRAGAHAGTPGDTPVADLARVRERLGWRPRHTLHEGLRRSVEWALRCPQAWRLEERLPS